MAIPLLVRSHEAHEAVARWADGRVLGLSGHALAETYSVLTRLPADARVSPDDAVAIIDDNFPETVQLSPDKAALAHRELQRSGIAGGAAYDGLVALAAREHNLVLTTRDARARPTYEAMRVQVDVIAAS
ncbi:type II toxin-antitoxin system VapC family toxin [Paramicrobacterium agarici]|uniref:type II toxin-antitoxin system VapC family toxin n=1 Tax=Paramicrobacterium agarici TaxID=630514 RepID=UPI001FE61A80|nr:type II toxin-antitoxin system VapC family toxin [Microbacterium agarici]